jgi:hypothetical protein
METNQLFFSVPSIKHKKNLVQYCIDMRIQYPHGSINSINIKLAIVQKLKKKLIG